MTFDHTSTTDDVLEGIDLSGKQAIVTGATSGLGIETARVLASHGAAVTIPARNLDKAEKVAEELRQSTGNPNIDIGEMELSRPESVRMFAESWLKTHDRLDILINNAAIMATPLERTSEGWELQFATNHIGHFVLANKLLPALKAAGSARVVTLSSGAHRAGMEQGAPLGACDFEDIHYESRSYEPWSAYGQSKLANVWFSVEFNDRFSAGGIEAFSVDPGEIPSTDLGRYIPEDVLQGMIAAATSRPDAKMKTIEQGAATSVWAATSRDLDGKGGAFLEHCQIAELAEGGLTGGYAPFAYDKDSARKLWDLSERLVS